MQIAITRYQIINIQADLDKMENDYQTDHSDLKKLTDQIEELTGKVEENGVKIDALGEKLEELSESIENLQESNRQWKINFQIVNRTFSRIRSSGCMTKSAK